jgi:hypothetical protein
LEGCLDAQSGVLPFSAELLIVDDFDVGNDNVFEGFGGFDEIEHR